MKVKELQGLLSKFDPELDVLCFTEDTKLVPADSHFRLLDIEDVNTTLGEQVRLEDGTPYLKLGKSPTSVAFATLVVTSNF